MVRSTLWTAYAVNPRIGAQLQEEKGPHLKSCTCLSISSWCTCWSMSVKLSSNDEKESCRSLSLSTLEIPTKWWGQSQRQAVATHDNRQVKQWSKADCFTLLNLITKFKSVNSEVRSKVQFSYLERYSPKGSCHHDESSMNHALAQNNHCEFWCGMHLTCKSIPIIPDRNGSVKRPEKVSQSYHRHSQS